MSNQTRGRPLRTAFCALLAAACLWLMAPGAQAKSASAGPAAATYKRSKAKAAPAPKVRKKPAAVKRRIRTSVRALAASTAALSAGLDKPSDLSLPESVTEPLLRSGAALVMDAESREVVYSKNAESVLPIASITKLMTAVVVLDSKAPLDEMITITKDDIDTEKGSSSRLPPGTRLSRVELLNLALMSSENRAAHALGRMHPGGLSSFVEAMNARARVLGMKQTRYVDPTGLSGHNRSSPLDLATLVKAASTYAHIRDLSTQAEGAVSVGGRTLSYRNTNALIHSKAWDIVLQKTGYIREAGRCVVMEIKAAGRKLIVVLLDSMTNQTRAEDARKLKDYTVRKLASLAKTREQDNEQPSPTADQEDAPPSATAHRVQMF